jgi:MoaA/NifB/PqqE/SkfB family radical SAM enzyme
VTTPPLRLLQIDLTDECPLFCAHCSNSSGPSRSAHFPIQRLLAIVTEAKGLGLERIVYSGGEPLRYPNLERALSFARDNCVPATIFTTGIRDKRTRLPVSAEDWCKLTRAGLVGAGFSVYAAPSRRGYHNDIVRTVPAIGDAFGANEEAIKAARTAGLAVEVHFIPSGITLSDLPEIYTWTVGLGCSVLHLQLPTYQGRNSARPFLQLNSSDEARLQETASVLRPIPGQTQFYVSRFWRSRWNAVSNFNCVANLEQLIIRTDGTISPCNACKYGSVTLGSENVLEERTTLADVWRHSCLLQQLRDRGGQVSSPNSCEGVLANMSGLAAVHT